MVVLSMLKPPESAGELGAGSGRLLLAIGGLRWSGIGAQENDY
jgi:hypothetical protein